ncbi:MAG: hypothetical protein R2855_17970 [Thermomicrobiales bacterium]
MSKSQARDYPARQMVFQDPYAALAPRMRIGTALEEPLRIHHLGDAGGNAANGWRSCWRSSGSTRVWPTAIPISRAAASGQHCARIGADPEVLVLDERVRLDASIQAQSVHPCATHQRLASPIRSSRMTCAWCAISVS